MGESVENEHKGETEIKKEQRTKQREKKGRYRENAESSEFQSALVWVFLERFDTTCTFFTFHTS